MATSQAQKEASIRYRELHKNDPEYKRKQAEAHKAWSLKHKAETAEKQRQKAKEQREQAKSELIFPPDESCLKYDSEASMRAAVINQKFGFSQIIGEWHSDKQAKHTILEKIGTDYRLKITTYFFFKTEQEAEEYCITHRMKLCGSRFNSE